MLRSFALLRDELLQQELLRGLAESASVRQQHQMQWL
jgi:hypothetical protein